jgi:hypothetical protein
VIPLKWYPCWKIKRILWFRIFRIKISRKFSLIHCHWVTQIETQIFSKSFLFFHLTFIRRKFAFYITILYWVRLNFHENLKAFGTQNCEMCVENVRECYERKCFSYFIWKLFAWWNLFDSQMFREEVLPKYFQIMNFDGYFYQN